MTGMVRACLAGWSSDTFSASGRSSPAALSGPHLALIWPSHAHPHPLAPSVHPLPDRLPCRDLLLPSVEQGSALARDGRVASTNVD
ncbi:hypothetical protein K431DRAFT_164180 [Polychaeton citri CBS 116435]|uniref:Uncharacterized protein n=1 Tax=Polychaeton citri CBS 116435 TaxID=1314669 RepID=A0A9P4QBB2_9PEZI|nr:hypothetical protein K431DRAFT_164180 [Polychaeton citri CBS 116435]